VLAVEHPVGDAVGVLAEQAAFPCGDAELVEIVPGLVTIVQTDIHDVRLTSRHGIWGYAHALDVGKISRRWDLRPGSWAIGRIHRVQIEVFIPSLVLHEKYVLAVATPKVPGNGPLCVIGDGARLIKRLIRF